MRRTRGLRLGVAIGTAIAMTALAIGIVVGSIPGAGNVIYGCYNKNNGALRVIDYPTASCGSSEVLLSWNQIGPQGEAGSAGPKGDTGDAGPKGDTGDAGPPGSSLPVRPTIGTLTATGQRQGPIATGLPFVGVDWSVISPRDAGSGLPTGKRQHKPLTLTIGADAASVRLLAAIFTNENLPSVQLAFLHEGETSPYMTIALTNAGLESVHLFTEGGMEYDVVSFTYQKIEITWVDPPVTTQDDWEAPTS